MTIRSNLLDLHSERDAGELDSFPFDRDGLIVLLLDLLLRLKLDRLQCLRRLVLIVRSVSPEAVKRAEKKTHFSDLLSGRLPVAASELADAV